MKTCPICDGEGKVIEEYLGEGTYVKYVCWWCHGKGEITIWRWLYFKYLTWRKLV